MLYRIFPLLLLALACSRISNTYQDDMLICGTDLPRNADYVTVSNTSHQVLKTGFEVLNMETQRPLPLVTQNGCVQIPPAGHYLIRSLSSNEAFIVDSQDLHPRDNIQLLDYSFDSFTIVCPDGALAASRNTTPADLLKASVQQNLHPAFRLEYEVSGFKQAFGLQDASSYPLLANFLEEKVYEVHFDLLNLLKNTHTRKTCQLQLDSTNPHAYLQINRAPIKEFIEIHGTRNIAVAGLSDSFSFQADADTAFIRYCVVPLDDDFETLQSPAGQVWIKDTENADCQNKTTKDAKSQTPFLNEIRSKFWALHYQAIDAVGNAEPYQTKVLLIMNRDAQRSIHDSAALSLATPLSMKRVEESLRAEWVRIHLPTRYERLMPKDVVRSALLGAYYQESASIVLPHMVGPLDSVLTSNRAGSRLLVGARSSGIAMVDVATGEKLWKIDQSIEAPYLAIAPDDQTFVLLGEELALKSFSAQDGHFIKDVPIDATAYEILGFDRSGEVLWVRTGEAAKGFRYRTGDPVGTIPEIENQASLSNEGERLELRTNDVLSLFSAATGTLIETVLFPEKDVDFYLLSRDRQTLVLRRASNMTLYKKQGQDWKKVSSWQETNVRTIVWSADETSLFIEQDNGILIQRTLDHPALVFRQMPDQSSLSRVILPLPNNQQVVTYSEDNKIRIWNLGLIRPQNALANAGVSYGSEFVYTPDGKNLIGFSEGFGVIMLNLSTGKSRVLLPSQDYMIANFAVSQDGRVLLIQEDQQIRAVDIETGTLLRAPIVPDENDSFHSAALSATGRYIIAGMFQNSSIRIWDTTTESEPRILESPGQITALKVVAIDPSGRFIAAAGTPQFVQIWDFTTGKVVKSLELIETHDKHLNFSKDGRKLMVIDGDSVRVWDMATYEMDFDYQDNFMRGASVEIAPEGNLFIASRDDDSIFMWDLSWEKPLKVPTAGRTGHGGLAMAPDGLSFALQNTDGSLAIWDMDNDPMRAQLCRRLGSYLSSELCDYL